MQEAKIADLVARMTLEEKLSLTIGQDFWTTNPVERLGIGSITMTDGPHGVRKAPTGNEAGIGNSIPATCFPTAVSLAASWDIALAEEVGRALGIESQSQNVQVLLGPGVNIKRTPLGGRNFEYFSEDPVLAGEIAAAWVQGVQSQGVGTSLKHYACNNQEWERMTINAEIDQRTLREIYLAAFERVVKKAQPWTVMSAYNRVNGTFASEHRQLLEEILKQEWGFAGVVVSDWGAVNDKAASLKAGMDLEMPGPRLKHTEILVGLVRQGELPEEAVNKAATRVLGLILKGLENRRPGINFNPEVHHTLARRGAAESTVLLKNEGGFLPLRPENLSSVAVIGQFARQPRYQGSGSSRVNPTRLDVPLAEIEGWLSPVVKVGFAVGYGEGEEPDPALLEEAVALAKSASVALIFAGLPDSFESEGWDRTHLFMPDSHNRLIEEVCKVQPSTVVILQNGSVVAMPWLAGPRAILETGLSGQAGGGALVDVLSGRVNPSGKLAETFPVRLQDTPAYLNYPGEGGVVRYGEGLFVGYRYYDKKEIKPLFPFGYGLSYTTFEYTRISSNLAEVHTGQNLEVRVKVKNTGSVSGKEVIQLYLRALFSGYVRPEKELKAFAKLELAAGEEKEALLTLTDRDFMIYDSERQQWRREGGDYELLAGGSSLDLPLKLVVKVVEEPGSFRRVYSRATPLKQFLEDEAGKATTLAVFKGTRMESWITGTDEMFLAIPVGKVANFGGVPDEAIDHLLEIFNR